MVSEWSTSGQRVPCGQRAARERATQRVSRGCLAIGRERAVGWGGDERWTRGGRTGSKELDEAGPEEEASREGVHGAHEDECAARGGVVRCARGEEEREADGLSDRCREAVGKRHEDGLGRARDPHAAHGRRVGELEQRDPCPESEALECLWRRSVCPSSVMSDGVVAGGRRQVVIVQHPTWPKSGAGAGRCGDGSIHAPEMTGIAAETHAIESRAGRPTDAKLWPKRKRGRTVENDRDEEDDKGLSTGDAEGHACATHESLVVTGCFRESESERKKRNRPMKTLWNRMPISSSMHCINAFASSSLLW